jgi:hypothetical protein
MSLRQFMKLFQGGDQAHGVWDPQHNKGWTKHEAPTQTDFEQHLSGKLGLGVVPVKTSGACQFAAIDIDIDTIDHGQLFVKVAQRGFPLSVCRSKSGGAHLYLFTREPGLPASAVQQVLKRWATVLGYPQAEIFPKQVKQSSENIGNWINLPYFGGDATTRYAVGPDGALTVEQFLAGIRCYDAESVFDETLDDKMAQMPPCLAALTQNGIKEGERNGALFNFAVFYRKSQPASWETAVTAHNAQYVQPPLDYREMQGVIQSASRKAYQYQCSEPPICNYCDRVQCLKLPFGVGNKSWDEAGAFDDAAVTNLRKLCTDPPKYIVEVNGRDIVLDWEELFHIQKFKSRVGQDLDLMIRGQKQPQWEQTLRNLLAKREDIEAPEDASMMGLVMEKFHEFLTLRERAQQKEDLLRGLPVQEGTHVLFRAGDLRRYLQGFKLDKVAGSDIFLALRKHGAFHKRIRLNGRMSLLWAFPLDEVNEQTLEFAVPDFKKDLEEDL